MMSTLRKKPGPVPQGYHDRLVLIRPDQDAALCDEASARGDRQVNATIRDIFDFWMAHRAFFQTWITTRNKLPHQE